MDGGDLARLGESLAAGVVVVGVLHALRIAAIKAQQRRRVWLSALTATFEGVVESSATDGLWTATSSSPRCWVARWRS